MPVAAAIHAGLINNTVTGIYSPVTLNNAWPTTTRLIIMTVSSCLGTILNGFFVSSFFIEDNLQKLGNAFLACAGLSDLIMTAIVMPVIAVVLLSGTWDSVPLCYMLQFLTEAATYCYSILFVMVSIENYIRLCRPIEAYNKFLSIHIGLICLLIFTISFSLAGAGVFYKLDYDYCTRKDYGNIHFRIATNVIFHGMPFVLIIVGLLAAAIKMRLHARQSLFYRRSSQYESDYSLVVLNIGVYLLYVGSWLPYLVVVYVYPNINDHKFYSCAWLGVYRCVLPSFLYGTLQTNFRDTFIHLFFYCFCKSSLAEARSRRNLRGRNYNVQVHILHQIVANKRVVDEEEQAAESRKL